MPLELIDIFAKKRGLGPGDTGFLINAKSKYVKTLPYHAMKFLNRFKQRYFEAKCPEEAAALKAEDERKAEEEKTNGVEESQESEEAEVKDEPMEGGNEEEVKKEVDSPVVTEEVDHSGILFVEREFKYDTFCFIASNLADPQDYLHFAFSTLAENYQTEKKTRFPIRVMPVSAVCEARSKDLEDVILPLVKDVLGGEDAPPHRFSINFNYKKGQADGERLTQKKAVSIIRNCVWAANPNCVQCIKYQDYAIVMELLDPLFMVGVAKDFNRLGGYVTSGVRNGFNLRDQQTDSEDDISDDPTLDEEENKRMKLRIKRKRRADKAELTPPNGDTKKSQEGEEEDEEEEGENEEEEEEEGGDAEEVNGGGD